MDGEGFTLTQKKRKATSPVRRPGVVNVVNEGEDTAAPPTARRRGRPAMAPPRATSQPTQSTLDNLVDTARAIAAAAEARAAGEAAKLAANPGAANPMVAQERMVEQEVLPVIFLPGPRVEEEVVTAEIDMQDTPTEPEC